MKTIYGTRTIIENVNIKFYSITKPSAYKYVDHQGRLKGQNVASHKISTRAPPAPSFDASYIINCFYVNEIMNNKTYEFVYDETNGWVWWDGSKWSRQHICLDPGFDCCAKMRNTQQREHTWLEGRNGQCTTIYKLEDNLQLIGTLNLQLGDMCFTVTNSYYIRFVWFKYNKCNWEFALFWIVLIVLFGWSWFGFGLSVVCEKVMNGWWIMMILIMMIVCVTVVVNGCHIGISNLFYTAAIGK